MLRKVLQVLIRSVCVIVLLLVLISLEGELSVVFAILLLAYTSPTSCKSISMHIIRTRKIPASLKEGACIILNGMIKVMNDRRTFRLKIGQMKIIIIRNIISGSFETVVIPITCH
jgi:hypothetical protein